MAELTLHTGFADNHDIIHVAWHDENNVPQVTEIEILVQPQDKPRTLEIRIDGEIVAEIERKHRYDPRQVLPVANVQAQPQ